MTFSTVSSYQGSSSDSFLSSVTDRLLNNNVIIMQISRNTSIACALLFLHVLICHMVFEGDAVIVVLSKGLIRKPQAANGNKQTTSVIVNSKIRRDSKGVRSKTKQKWIKSWISRVLRKSGGFRSKSCCKQQNTTHHNKRSISSRFYNNKSRLKNLRYFYL